MLQFLFSHFNRCQSRRDALYETKKILDRIKLHSDEARKVDCTIGYLIDNNIHINYLAYNREGKG